MPYFRIVGTLPKKRRTLFPNGDDGFYAEELVGEEGFSSDLSHVYHVNPPTMIVDATTVDSPEMEQIDNWPLIPRHFRTEDVRSGTDMVLGRVPLLTNSDVTIGYVTATEISPIFRDANGDECIYIQVGTATLHSTFGPLEVGAGDYVVIPAGVTHQWEPHGAGVAALTIESRGHIKPPRRYLSEKGQFLEMAPYRERDLRGPEALAPPRDGLADVIVKRGNRLTKLTYRHHPFDAIGWNGCVYPYAFSIHDFEPIVGRIHQPPPVHQTFEGPGFVLCSFVPRLSDYDAAAVGGPANHLNIDSDEVMFYAGGDYSARAGSGIAAGSISLHPLGWTHGPQTQPTGKRKPGVMLDELAVMVDTFQPLHMTTQATEVEDPTYFTSWDRNMGGADANA